MTQSVLVLFAHPAQRHSRANRALFALARRQPQVTAVDLYHEYPDGHINVNWEQQRLVAHDVVIMQFPFYWYGTPALLKDWQDLVLQYGFAFGKGGDALHNKPLLCAITTGASAHTYSRDGVNRFSVRELLRPIEATAHLCGMPYLPPLVLYSALTAHEDGRLQQHLRHWQLVLAGLTSGTLPPARVAAFATLNDYIATIDG